MDLRDKTVLVLGLARSGVSAARALAQRGAHVIVNDRAPAEKVAEDLAQLADLHLEIITGSHPLQIFDRGIDLVVKNPGIPNQIPPLARARELGIPVISEVELAFQLTRALFVGITGSNGKTTTTGWVGEIMRADRDHVIVAGNIGLPLTHEVADLGPETLVVAELSSFQLEDIETFRPHVAALLNLVPAHLDRHGTFESYAAAKARIFMNQTSDDWAVLNADDKLVRAMVGQVTGRVALFSTHEPVERGAFFDDGYLTIRGFGEELRLCHVNELGIGYRHNQENGLAAALISYLVGARAESIRHGLVSFRGMPHRFQVVATIRGVRYINDSKATNPEATLTALAAPTEPIVLIAGGLERGIDLSALTSAVAERAKAVVLLGETKDRLHAELTAMGYSKVTRVATMAEAVAVAQTQAEAGDCVLLSPACASWDMYKDFEERGSDFMKEVSRLKGGDDAGAQTLS